MKKDEEKRKKRKLKWQVKLILYLILFILYCFFIGTKGIYIKEFKIETNKITAKENGLKILQFSDLHYGSSVNEKDLKKLVEKINMAKADIIIFTGDLIDEDYELEEKEKEYIIKQLTKMNAALGKYYITGEEDTKKAEEILNGSNFVNINSSEQIIYLSNNSPLLLSGKNNTKDYFENNELVPDLKILAIHNPDDIDKLKDYNFDIALSGHTHNGQINIPKIKNMLIKSKYQKNYQKVKNTKLYINPGIGTSKINVRLFNHPTIYLYRINKASN